MRELDEAILRAVADWRTPLLNRVMTDITTLGSVTVIVVVTVAAFILLRTVAHDRVGAAMIATAPAGAELLAEVLKRLLESPRPTIVPHLVEFTGFSHPSGHALVATATYGTLAAIICGYVEQRGGRIAVRTMCWTIAGLVSISRVYLGVHYPSDIISGFLLGVAWLHATAYIYQWNWRSGLRRAKSG